MKIVQPIIFVICLALMAPFVYREVIDNNEIVLAIGYLGLIMLLLSRFILANKRNK